MPRLTVSFTYRKPLPPDTLKSCVCVLLCVCFEDINLTLRFPALPGSVGLEPVCFDTMEQGEHSVRRLSTVSSVIDPSFTHTTKWIWYWENEYHKWIEYGSIVSEQLLLLLFL